MYIMREKEAGTDNKTRMLTTEKKKKKTQNNGNQWSVEGFYIVY